MVFKKGQCSPSDLQLIQQTQKKWRTEDGLPRILVLTCFLSLNRDIICGMGFLMTTWATALGAATLSLPEVFPSSFFRGRKRQFWVIWEHVVCIGKLGLTTAAFYCQERWSFRYYGRKTHRVSARPVPLWRNLGHLLNATSVEKPCAFLWVFRLQIYLSGDAVDSLMETGHADSISVRFCNYWWGSKGLYSSAEIKDLQH